MGGKAQELARQREREAFEATQLTQLAPTDPIRRAKVLDGVPTPPPGDTPNGTAKKPAGADGDMAQAGAEPTAQDPTAQSEGQPTPEHTPEVEPSPAQDTRPAKAEDAPDSPPPARKKAAKK